MNVATISVPAKDGKEDKPAPRKKYTELVDENRKLRLDGIQWQEELLSALDEKEQLQADYNKVVLNQSRLESLCRELHRQIKHEREERQLKVGEEGEEPKEPSAKMNATLEERVTELKSICDQKANENEQKYLKLVIEMKIKFKKTKALLASQQDLVSRLEALVVDLASQLSVYTNVYQALCAMLNKGLEVVEEFTGNVNQVTNTREGLKKDVLAWETRWKESRKMLREVTEQKATYQCELSLSNQKYAELEKLYHSLQNEQVLIVHVEPGQGPSQSTDGSE